jgi:hypothetical protein
MAEEGVVGTYNGSQAREVLVTLEQWGAMRGRQPSTAGPAPAPRRPSNRILLTPQTPDDAGLLEEGIDDDAAGAAGTPDRLDLGKTADRMPPWEDEEDDSDFDLHEQEGDPRNSPKTGPADPALRAWKAESA